MKRDAMERLEDAIFAHTSTVLQPEFKKHRAGVLRAVRALLRERAMLGMCAVPVKGRFWSKARLESLRVGREVFAAVLKGGKRK